MAAVVTAAVALAALSTPSNDAPPSASSGVPELLAAHTPPPAPAVVEDIFCTCSFVASRVRRVQLPQVAKHAWPHGKGLRHLKQVTNFARKMVGHHPHDDLDTSTARSFSRDATRCIPSSTVAVLFLLMLHSTNILEVFQEGKYTGPVKRSGRSTVLINLQRAFVVA